MFTVNINNVPEYAKDKNGYFVAKLVDGILWFWGVYEDEEKAYDAARSFDNGIVIKRGV